MIGKRFTNLYTLLICFSSTETILTFFLPTINAYSIRLKSIFTAENHFYCLIFAFGFHPTCKFVFWKNHIHAQF